MFLNIGDIVTLMSVDWRVVSKNEVYQTYELQCIHNKQIRKYYPEKALFLAMQGFDNSIPRYVDIEEFIKL